MAQWVKLSLVPHQHPILEHQFLEIHLGRQWMTAYLLVHLPTVLDQGGVLGYWLQPGPALVVEVIWGVANG